MPTPTCPAFTLALHPAAQGIRAYLLAPGATVRMEGVDLAQTTLKLEDGHLVMQTPSGSTLLLLEFAASSTHRCGVTFTTQQGDVLRGTDMLHMLGTPHTQTKAVVGVAEDMHAHLPPLLYL